MRRHGTRPRQRGGIATLFAVTLPLVAGMVGLALEFAVLFQRQAQLQQVADAVALMAAQQLNGTSGGISQTLARAYSLTADRPLRGVGPIVFSSGGRGVGRAPARPRGG
ncbi:pilus assembly protein TadG-related protein [Pseudoduganella sp.]|uniref:pilus assembly protein TadG-related protein n=1 Tax=Pseudoduganella sp. TaxID=1880898 RepID=UPI0035B29568